MEKERIQFVQKKLSMYTELAKSVLDKNSEVSRISLILTLCRPRK